MGLFKTTDTSRPPVADLETATIEVDGQSLELAKALVAARVEGNGLSVIVYHPAFADLSDEPRAQAAVEILVAAPGRGRPAPGGRPGRPGDATRRSTRST